MAKLILNAGTTNNDKTGDTLRAGALKIKANFDEIYTALANDGSHISGGPVLKTGSYNDLTNKPSFSPVAVSGNFYDLDARPDLGIFVGEPPNETGTAGNVFGNMAYADGSFYFCFEDYVQQLSFTGLNALNDNSYHLNIPWLAGYQALLDAFQNSMALSVNPGTDGNWRNITAISKNTETNKLDITYEGSNFAATTGISVKINQPQIWKSIPWSPDYSNPFPGISTGDWTWPEISGGTRALLGGSQNSWIEGQSPGGLLLHNDYAITLNVGNGVNDKYLVLNTDGSIGLTNGGSISETPAEAILTLLQFGNIPWTNTNVYTRISETEYQALPDGPTITRDGSGLWSLGYDGTVYYVTEDRYGWDPTPSGVGQIHSTLSAASTDIRTVDNITWAFGHDKTLTLPADGILRSANESFTAYSQHLDSYSRQYQTPTSWGAYPQDDSGTNDAWAWIELSLYNKETPKIQIETTKASDGIINHWEFNENGNFVLPLNGGIVPTGALPGQSLVIRPTMGNMTFTSSGFIVAGVELTITLTSLQYASASQEAFTYEITGATAEQLGLGSLIGEFGQANWVDTGGNTGYNQITIPVPGGSSATTLTLTITDTSVYHNVAGYQFANNPFTVTDNGVSGIENSHIHLLAGDPSTVDLYLGDDNQYVKIEKNGGDVVVGTNTNSKRWRFGSDGQFTLPAGGNIVLSTGAPAFVYISVLKQLVSDSTDFADFQSRIAAL